MKWKFKESHKNIPSIISGVYLIYSKRYPHKFYIGASMNVLKRIKEHYGSEFHEHGQKNIRKHIINYGVTDLDYKILKVCNEYSLIYWEQHYISELKPTWNIHRFASNPDMVTTSMARKIALQEISNETHQETLINIERQVLQYCNREYIPEIIIPL